MGSGEEEARGNKRWEQGASLPRVGCVAGGFGHRTQVSAGWGHCEGYSPGAPRGQELQLHRECPGSEEEMGRK